MSVEALHQQPTHGMLEAQALEEWLLVTLEQHDGLCLDNEKDRAKLSTALATALVSTAVNGINSESALPRSSQHLQ